MSLLSLLSLGNLWAQTGYEPGSFIDNDDKLTECTILNRDAARSPEEFSYKLPGESESRKAGINDVKEFTVGSNTYVRFEGKVDKSSQVLGKLSESGEPEWETRKIFLKQIVNGKAKLYRYRDATLDLYFFSVDNSPIEQLVYKKMKVTEANSRRNANVVAVAFIENTFYKSQLAARVSCGPSIPAARMPAYQISALQKHFERFNACNGEEVVKQKNNNSLSVTAGLDFGTLHEVSILTERSDKDYGFQVGVAAEVALPFNNGKWTVLFQPTYQTSIGSTPDWKHMSIEIPSGVRHYFFLPKFDIFLNGFVVPDFAINYETPRTKNIKRDAIVALCGGAGVGLRMNRLSAEFRYYFRRAYVHAFVFVTEYNKPSVIVAYRLKKKDN